MKVDEGKELMEATLEGAKLRLRPILMTAFAFILGCVPLVRANGAGAASRVAIGNVVVYGMLMATFIGIFLTPGLFVLVERMKSWMGQGGTTSTGTPSERPPHGAPGHGFDGDVPAPIATHSMGEVRS
jgi:HAE1 family hydrophobic/amphiphilic exporter-1